MTDDVLVTMRGAIIDPHMNKHGLCGPMTLDHGCVLNAMHWDSREACSVVMKSHVRSHVDKLGIVSTVYADAPGHFPQETVPTWLRLLDAMPRSVPLWIPESSIARRYATYIGHVLGLEAGRFVHARGPISVGQLYLYRPSPRYSGKPMNRPLTIRSRDDFLLMRRVLRPRNPPDYIYPSTLLLIHREKSRALTNSRSVALGLLQASRDLGLKFEIRTLGRGPLLEDAVAFRSARVVVGVHGAGMANIVFCSDNVSIVEIGYTTGMPMPEIYFDQARFLGLRYWAVAGRGSYNGQVTVGVSALTNTVALAVSSDAVADM